MCSPTSTAGSGSGSTGIINAEIENLLDQDYQLAEGYRSAGRGFYATLGYTY